LCFTLSNCDTLFILKAAKFAFFQLASDTEQKVTKSQNPVSIHLLIGNAAEGVTSFSGMDSREVPTSIFSSRFSMTHSHEARLFVIAVTLIDTVHNLSSLSTQRAITIVIGTVTINFARGESFKLNVRFTLCEPFFCESLCLFGGIAIGIQFIGGGGGKGNAVLHGGYFLSLVGKTIIQ
jgi:hypothetical protein